MKNIVISVVKISLLISLLLIIYNNSLILDDFHPSYNSLAIESKEANAGNNKGFFIHINLESLQLCLYKDGSLIRSYPVSGGKIETPSPTGTWKIISKSTWGEGFGGSWMGLNVPWGTLILDTF